MEVWERAGVKKDSQVSEMDFLAHGDAMQEARTTQRKSGRTWRGTGMMGFISKHLI